MSFERVHRSRSQSPQTSSSTSQFAPRPFPVQEPKRPPTQEDIENEAFQQNKFEAFGLQFKEKHGTITPVEQERLGVLQAKMDSFWAQRMEQAKAQPNLLEILIRNSQATQTTESQASVQANTIQAKSDTTGDHPDSSVEQHPNKTGMPDALKAGVESLSGYSLDDVRVHYNSPKPAQLQALAYTQGTEIHVASGQDKHLPHEAWHVVQQAQGRVKPTMQMKDGVLVNDDAGLEHEADVMGAKALQMRGHEDTTTRVGDNAESPDQRHGTKGDASQRQGETIGASDEKVWLNFLSTPQNGAMPVQGVFEEIWALAVEYAIPLSIALAVAGIYGTVETVQFIMRYIQRGKDVGEGLEAVLQGKKSIESEEEVSDVSGGKHEVGSKDKAVSKLVESPETPSSGKETAVKEKSLMEGVAGDCLYTAVSIASGGKAEGQEVALRRIATQWLLDQPDNAAIFAYEDRGALIDVVSTPQHWNDDAGDLSAVVLAYSLGITLQVITGYNKYVFNPGHKKVTIYYHNNHYTSFPRLGVHTGQEGVVLAKPGKKKSGSVSSSTLPKGVTNLRVQQGPSCWLTVIESMLESEGMDTSTLKLLLGMYEKDEEIERWEKIQPKQTEQMEGYTSAMLKNKENVTSIVTRLTSFRDKGGKQKNATVFITKQELQRLLQRVSPSIVHSVEAFTFVNDIALVDDILPVYMKVERQLTDILAAMGNEYWKKQVHSFFKLPDAPIDKNTEWDDFKLTMEHQVKLPAWVGTSMGIKGKHLPEKDTDFRGLNPVFESNNHAILMIGYDTDNEGEYVQYKNPNRGNIKYTVSFDQFKQMAGNTELQLFSFKLGLGGAKSLVG